MKIASLPTVYLCSSRCPELCNMPIRRSAVALVVLALGGSVPAQGVTKRLYKDSIYADWGRLPRALQQTDRLGKIATKVEPRCNSNETSFTTMACELLFYNHLGCRKDVITSRSSIRYKTKLLVGRSARFVFVRVRYPLVQLLIARKG